MTYYKPRDWKRDGEIEVRLTWGELSLASEVGKLRCISALQNDRDPGDTGYDNLWQKCITGAAAEMAASKYLGVYWAGSLGDLGASDVGGYQTKVNNNQYYDDMRIQRRNGPGVYIHMLSHEYLPRFVICGWLAWPDPRREDWWGEKAKKGQPAFFVPRSAVRPMSELPNDPVDYIKRLTSPLSCEMI